MQFGMKGKLSPWYIRLLKILDCVVHVAYVLALPPSLYGVHLVFDVSMLKKYHRDGYYIIKWESVLLGNNLYYQEESIAILNCDVRNLRTKEVKFVKVQWKPRLVEETTKVIQKDMQDKYLQLFDNSGTNLLLS